MNPFKYEYVKTNDIFNNIVLIKNFSIIEIILLLLLIILYILLIYNIFPYIYIYYKYIITKRKKEKKLFLLKQITLEKEIEEKINKDIKTN